MRSFLVIAVVLCLTAVALTPRLTTSSESAAAVPERQELTVGDVIPASELHIVTHPGRYGLGPEQPGSRYAVAYGRLIRVDESSHKVLSVIRMVNGILD